MKEYFSGDSETALETLKNEVDYEQEADQNCCLAIIEASIAVGVCVNSGSDYTAAAATTTTVHEKMDLVWKREEEGDDEINIKAEVEVKKEEEKWEEKMMKVL